MPSKRGSILLMFLLFGACSVTCQAALVREFLTVFSGNELCLGAFFGIWLLWISIGAGVGSMVARLPRGLLTIFVLASLVAGMAPVAQIWAVRHVRTVYNMPPGLLLGFRQMLLFTLCCLGPFSFFVGFTFPIGCRLFAGGTDREAAGIGWVYVAECLGFLCGGVVFSFVLVYSYNAIAIGAALGLAMFLGSVILVADGAGQVTRGVCCALGVVLVLAWACAYPFIQRADRLSIEQRWVSLKTDGEQLQSVDSKYEHLALGEREGQYEVFASGNAAFHFPDPYDFPAVANYVAAEHPSAKSVLIVGHAAHGLLAEFLKTGIRRVDHVDLDPAVLAMIRPYLPADDKAALRSDKVQQHYMDGRLYVKACTERYDLIFVNVPDPSTAMLNRYYTREFFAQLRRILEPDGVVAITVACSPSYIGDILGDFTGSIFHTFRSEFNHLVISPGDHAYIFGSNAPGRVTSDPAVLAKRFLSKKLDLPTFTEHHFMMLFPSGTTEQLYDDMMARDPAGPPPKPVRKEPVLFEKPGEVRAQRRPAKLNTDLKPVSYFYNLLLWDQYTSSNLHRLFRWVERLRPSRALALLAGLVLLRLGYVALFRKSEDSQIRTNAVLAITVCGFSAMAIDVLMLFAYQSLFGYLYHMVGLLVALFMFGLATGSTLMNLGLRRVRKGTRCLIGLQAALIAYTLALPMLISLLSSALGRHPLLDQAAFMGLVTLGGIITGAQFPLVAKLYLDRSSGIAATAGLVDAGDHFGAAFGALLSGSILIPILGMVATCGAIAVLNAACLVLVAATAVQTRFAAPAGTVSSPEAT